MKLRSIGCLALAACGSSPPPAGPDAPPRFDATPDAPWYAVTSNVVGGQAADGGVAGATICVLGHDEIPCATSGANGDYTISLPDLQGQDLAIEVSATGHLGEVTLLDEPLDSSVGHQTIWESNVVYTDDEATAELATGAGFTYPGAGTGFLKLTAISGTSGFAGATATIAPMAGGSLTAKGPVYFDDNGPNPSLTATTSHGIVAFGDITPGMYAVTVTAPSGPCHPGLDGQVVSGDWPPAGSETTDVEVVADAYTMGVAVYCQ